jgi:3-(3-hydroxy-phenyl)propionate hydroxylase
MNLGIQDAVNLGWKLAEVVKGTAPETLLDTYHAERHPVAAGLIRYPMATVALSRRDDRTKALGTIVTDLVNMEEARTAIAGEMSGLAIRYDLGEGHPLLGRRMPDLEIETSDGAVRVYALMHRAQPLLITVGKRKAVDLGDWSDRVRRIDARYKGPWALPVIGAVPAPAAVLIRPDGHVAWVGEGTGEGLAEALAKWFGSPR